MRKQYLHLSAYTCNICAGPVIAGSLGVRENEISKETEISAVGSICLSCGHRPEEAAETGDVRYFFPIQWEPVSASSAVRPKTAFVEGPDRAEPH